MVTAYRTGLAVALAAALWAGPAAAQSALPLKGTLDDATATDPAAEDVPVVTSTPLKETRLDIVPLEPPPPPRKARAPADPYAPTGIGSNVLRVYPSLTVGGIYSSNVTNAHSNPKAALGLALRPSIKLETDWLRHSLTAGLDGDFETYSTGGGSDTRTLDVFQRLRLDVRRHTTATLYTDYLQDRSSVSDPVEHTLTGSLAVAQDFGPVTATATAGLADKMFEDSPLPGPGRQSNDDLDYVQPSAGLRASFAMSDMLQPYLEATYAPRYHGTTPDRFGLDRDSQGVQMTAGVTVADDPFWTGDIGLTYIDRRYRDQALDAVSALGITGNITWSPTEITRVILQAGTSVDDTASATTGGTRKWTGSVDVTQAIRDNVDLTGGGGIEIEDTSSGYDTTYTANLGVSWAFNPNLAWTAGYDVTWLDSATKANSYVEHRLLTGLRLSQ